MLSILITAYREEKTIGLTITNMVQGLSSNFEILLACPDKETRQAAEKALQDLGQIHKFQHIQDPRSGKPAALRLLFQQAKGEFLVLTDGDVVVETGAVQKLVDFLVFQKTFGGVSGRPFSMDKKANFWGYVGHLLADGADIVRTKKILQDKTFFPMSGYLLAIRNFPDLNLPTDTLVDDAWLSYYIAQKGLSVGYEPEARVGVKYPDNLSDYLKQKRRSTGGYAQLKKDSITIGVEGSRSFWQELEMLFFPLTYATNLLEFGWSLALYPLRLYLWILIFWDQKVLHKSLMSKSGWERIESTK